MGNEEVCKKLRKMLHAMARKAFNKDLTKILSSRNQELWLLGLDSQNELFVDICRSIDPNILGAIQAKGFIDSDAGYKADAQTVLPLDGKKADIFLLNTVYFSARAAELEPLVVHELAHLLEQIGEKPTPRGSDEVNSDEILKSLDPNILRLHSKEWALHLAAGGRTLLAKDLTTHKSIRAFLEAAIPHYDRQGPIYAKKGP
jgi:hypothetical protein